MSDEKEDYRIDEQVQEAGPSGFDLAKIVAGMLNDPETFDSCQRLGEAVLSKPAKQEPKRRDPKADRLITLYGEFRQSCITYGDPLGCYLLVIVNAELLDDIYKETEGIEGKPARELQKLLTLAGFGGIKVMSSYTFDEICDKLRVLIYDLGGNPDL